MRYAYLEAGPRAGPLVLCLHGFPDHAPTWTHLLPALADAGFHAVAPWLRGYHPTSAASDGAYQAGALAADANALRAALGGDDRAAIVGHDWGAIAAYGAVNTQPERWRRVVTMAVPPLPVFQGAWRDTSQWRRSAYIALFQLPLVPEWLAVRDDAAMIDRLYARWSRHMDPPAGYLDALKATLTHPGTMSAALGYYRAMVNPLRRRARYAAEERAWKRLPRTPLLYLHGVHDGAMGVEYARRASPLLPEGSRVEILERCGHFLHLERPDEVNAHILDWLA